MSTLHTDQLRGPAPGPALTHIRARLAVTTFSHGAVDFFSFTIVPLMTVLEGRLSLTSGQAAAIIGVGSLCSGLIQPLVAWLSDRFDTRWLGTLGFLVAVVAVGSLGFVSSYPALLLLQVLGSAGIGAFHPVAAAAAGQLSSQRRAFGVAAFYCAGMFGGIAGNITTPIWVRFFGHGSAAAGLKSLAWFIVPGLLSVLLLAWAIHPVAHRHEGATQSHASLDPAVRRAKWYAIGVLYVVNVVRFAVDLALITLIIRWTEALTLEHAGASALSDELRTRAAMLNGPLQAAKQIGMGVGGLGIAMLMRPRFEKPMMVGVPVLGCAMIALMPHMPGTTGAFLVTVVAGLGYGGMVSATIAMAQRLLPHRTGLASGLMMGGAWSVASVGAPLAEMLHQRVGLNGAFLGVAVLCLLSGVLSLALPRAAIMP